jgi:hypothetical protein
MAQPRPPKDKTPPPRKEGGVKTGPGEAQTFGDATPAPAREGGMIEEGGPPPTPKREGGMLSEG